MENGHLLRDPYGLVQLLQPHNPGKLYYFLALRKGIWQFRMQASLVFS